LNTSLVSFSLDPTDLLAGFLVLMLLKAYIVFMSLEKCFFAVLVGLHYSHDLCFAGIGVFLCFPVLDTISRF